MLSFCAMLALGATVADDTPRGTDLVARVEVGKLAGDLRSAWDELEPLFVVWPSLGSIASNTRESWTEVTELFEKASGADLDRPTAVATMVVDFDATGGAAWAAVVRGSMPKKPEGSDFLIDGQAAHRIAGRDLAWSIVGEALVAGNERGVQRQVRQLAGKKPNLDEPIGVRVRRLRERAPVLVAFETPASLRAELESLLTNIGPLVSAVHGGTLVAKPGRLWMQLSATDDDEQKAIEHGVRAFVAMVRASTALLQGGSEAIIGLDLLGARPDAVPASVDAPALETLADDWLEGFHIDAKIRKRRPEVIEAELKLSSYRGLAAALGVMAVMLVPTTVGPRAEAEVLLELLRRAQQAHKSALGEYVSCGPIPETLPEGPVAWPEGSCFDALSFVPPAKVRFQLIAGVEEGELVLMAQGDTNGDGKPEIWMLKGNDVSIEQLIPPP